ncbi:MAG: Gldg family protein [Gammaproteobacteria bacterium]|nr:Gldg family protein [Gammaproteobacteria bacterium]
MVRRLLFLGLLGACLLLAARVSEQYTWQLDVSGQRIHSLSTTAQDALDALQAPLEITAFIPDYPVQRAQIEQLLAPYLAHPGRPTLRFIDPVEQPALAREHGVTRHGELQLQAGPRREVIPVPGTAAIDLALNRLALRGERWIVTLKGHGEAEPNETPGGLARFVSHAEVLGYRFVAVDPRNTTGLPDNTAVLLIAGPEQGYSAQTLAQIGRFAARGGPVMWLLDRADPVTFPDGPRVGTLPGIVVDAAAAQYGLDSPDNAVVNDYPKALLRRPPEGASVLKQARALTLADSGGWTVVGRLDSSPRSWNETGDLHGRIGRNPDLGEQVGPVSVGLALQREDDGIEQRLLVIGSRHFITNDQIGQGQNLTLALGLLNWLSDNALVAADSAAPDLDIRWSARMAGVLALGLMAGLPASYLAFGLWLRARRRRA